MGLKPGTPMTSIPIDRVFIGSCTNGRIEDLRAAAAVVRGHHVATGVRAMVVPGSGLVKRQAEAEGLDKIFREAGFEWREAGCSMCLAMNPDKLKPGERCASTSNRNFEGRQGKGGRTHLVSPPWPPPPPSPDISSMFALGDQALISGQWSGVSGQKEQRSDSGLYGLATVRQAFLPVVPRPVAAGGHTGVNISKRAQFWPRPPRPHRAFRNAPMKPFRQHTGLVAPLDRSNVDTDQIIPKQFLKRIERTGLGKLLFFDWRFLPDGSPNPEFVLNRPAYQGVSILLARDNFGCGQPRARPLGTGGLRLPVVIAPTFADIFYNNCFKNGMLPIRLSPEQVDELFQKAQSPEGLTLTSISSSCRSATARAGQPRSSWIRSAASVCWKASTTSA